MLAIQLKPGQEELSTFRLSNGGDGVIQMRAYAMDFASRPGQSYVFTEPGHSSYSPSAWIQLSPSSFDLQPGQQMEVEARITVPALVEPGERHAAVFFETVPPQEDTGISVAVGSRLTALLYLTVPGPGFQPAPEAGIQAITMPGYTQGGPLDFSLTLHNAGNVHVRVAARATFTGLWGRHVGELDLGDAVVLPGSERTINGSLEDVPFMDRLFARFVIGYYDEDGKLVNKSETVRLWVLPWKLLVPLMLLAAGVTAMLIVFKKKYQFRLEPRAPRTLQWGNFGTVWPRSGTRRSKR